MCRELCRIIICAGLLISSLSLSKNAYAQSGEDIAKGLLKALIESQLQRQKSPPPPNNLSPGRRPAPLPNPSGELQQLRVISATFAQEASTLAALVNTDAQRSYQLRRVLPDVIRLQASATVVKQECEHHHHHSELNEPFKSLNAEWKTVAHQLEHLPGLSPQTNACVQRLSGLDQQYCAVLGIREQFDSTALTKEVYTLAAWLRQLKDDLSETAPVPGRQHHQTESNLAGLIHQTDYFASLVSGSVPLQVIHSEYRKLYSQWKSLEPQLRGYAGHNIDRGIRRVTQSHRSIHELLRLEMGVDKELLLHFIHETGEQVQAVCRSITLEQLMRVPDGGAIPSAADTLQGTIQNLDDLVHRDQPATAVAEAWGYVDEAWQLFYFYTQAIPTPQVQAQIQAASDALVATRDTLGIAVRYDLSDAIASATSLQGQADQLLTAVRQWRTHGGVSQQLVSQTQDLQRRCGELVALLHTRRYQRNAESACDDIVSRWQAIRPELLKCETDERQTLTYLTGTFTPELIRLRTMLQD